jgi:two-component system sensor histidine kinase/response regulator
MARNPKRLISFLRRGDRPASSTPPKPTPPGRAATKDLRFHPALLAIAICLSILVCGAVITAWTWDALVTFVAAGPLFGIIAVLGCQLVGQIRRNALVTRKQHHCEAQLRQLLHSDVTEGLCLLDADGNMQIWNVTAQHLMGYSGEEVIGRNFRMLFPPDAIAAGEPARLLKVARERGKLVDEVWLVRRDGSRFLARTEIDAVRDEHGSLCGFVQMARNITEQRDQEKQRESLLHELAAERDGAEEANQAKSRFLALVTHELRTPLHGILGYAELLALEGGLTPAQDAQIAAIRDAGQYLLNIINTVLDITQIESGRTELTPASIKLDTLVKACMDVVRPVADGKNLALKVNIVPSLHVLADRARLQQILLNLIGNAVKFTPSGSVEVRAMPSANTGTTRLEVVDTGPGIWAKHHNKLFNVFERLNANSVSGIEGAGLGLALSAKLVRRMGGEIGYADNPGGGSIFWVELPCGEAIANVADQATVAAAIPDHETLRVLIADDDPLNRDIASHFLTLAGYEVVCVGNGAEALELAASETFDAILMDVRMPLMNGLEATRRIRALPAPYGTVPVVAMTAQAFTEQVEACRQAGMGYHIAKPFSQDELLNTLASVVATHRSTDAIPTRPVEPQADTAAEPEEPVFDQAAFRCICGVLPPERLAEDLRTLAARAEGLLGQLQVREVTGNLPELAEAAHKLAGGAGTFGFLLLAARARRFEAAADAAAANRDVLAEQLCQAIPEALAIIRSQLAHPAVHPA